MNKKSVLGWLALVNYVLFAVNLAVGSLPVAAFNLFCATYVYLCYHSLNTKRG
jgi:hypothetical protein